jgi:hypothetical protein
MKRPGPSPEITKLPPLTLNRFVTSIPLVAKSAAGGVLVYEKLETAHGLNMYG